MPRDDVDPRTVKLPADNDSPARAVIVSGIHSNIIAYAHRTIQEP